MFKNFYYKITSHFPSKSGYKAWEELNQVLNHGGIAMSIQAVKDESGSYFMAESTNLPQKHIVTTGRTLSELDQNIQDAIFSVFQVPAY